MRKKLLTLSSTVAVAAMFCTSVYAQKPQDIHGTASNYFSATHQQVEFRNQDILTLETENKQEIVINNNQDIQSDVLSSSSQSAKPEDSSSSDVQSAKPEDSSSSDAQSTEPEDSSSSDAQSTKPEDSSSSDAQSTEPEDSSSSDAQSTEPEDSSSSDAQSTEPEDSSSSDAQSTEPEDSSSSDAQSTEPEDSSSDEYVLGENQESKGAAGWQTKNFGSYSAAVYVDASGKCLVGPHYLSIGQNGQPGGYFFFYDNGALAWTSMIEWQGKTYESRDGRLVTGLVSKNFGSYYADVYYNPQQNGAMAQNAVVDVNGQKMLFYGTGARAWSDRPTINGKNYFVKDGIVQVGLIPVNYGSYTADNYFDPKDNGAMAIGVRDVNGRKMLFYGTGARAWSDRPVMDGKTYYVKDGFVQMGLVPVNYGSYTADNYFDPKDNGAMAIGIRDVNGQKMFFYGTGARAWSDRPVMDGKTYYVKDGFVQMGLIPVNYGSYTADNYFDPKDNGAMAIGVREINGQKMFFYGTGARAWSDTPTMDGKTYCVQNGVMVTGWVVRNFGSYQANSYFDKNTGAMAVGPTNIEGALYFFDHNGAQQWGEAVLTHDGVHYYFVRNGRIVVNQSISFQGKNYIAASNGVLTEITVKKNIAIDVSYHQGLIDWQAVANSGIKYAIIRAVGWNKAANTVGGIDTMFDYNVREAKKYGINVGAYIYTYAKNEGEVLQEVNAFRSAMEKLERDGYRLDLPVFVDQEDPSLLRDLTNQDRTRLLRYEMVLLDQKGYYPGMYMSTSWSQYNVDAEGLYREGYDMWVADYRTSVQNPVWAGRCAMWQYSSKGSVPGIRTNVDMNYIYKDYSGIIRGSNNTGMSSVARFQVRNQNADNQLVEDTILNLLAAIVNNEVGSGLGLSGRDRTNLYQSQAIAAHSWLLYNYAIMGEVPSVGLNYNGNYNVIRQEIESVQDKVVTYQGQPALTVYGSCNNGKTNASGDYWSKEVSYLPAGIESKYDHQMASQFFPTVSRPRTAKEVSNELKNKHGIDTSNSPDPSKWFQINGRNAGNYITTLNICGKTIKGGTLNDNFSPIRSSDFTVEYNSNQDQFIFKSYGNGHGVGMSQFGAAGYIAKEGWDYTRVLNHYFPNTVVETFKH